MKNTMNPKLSLQGVRRRFWVGALILSSASAFASTTVTFQVDMSAQIAASTFTPGTDTVSVSGTFNGWNTTATPLARVGTSSLYQVTVNDAADSNPGFVQYKFVQDGSSYETTLGNGNGGNNENRVATLPATSGGSITTPYAYFNDAGPTTGVPVTFTVDMAEQIHLGNFNPQTQSVACLGYFEGWSDANFTLVNNPANNVTNGGVITSMPYSGTYTWAASPGEIANYKYVYYTTSGDDTYESVGTANADPADNQDNRFFAQPTTATTLPTVSFDDQPFSNTVTNTVVFEVDMSVEVLTGNFTNGVSTVALRGDVINGWGETEMTELPAPNTNIYATTNTYVVAAGSQEYFKYYIDAGSQWESLANNRSLTFLSQNGTFTNGPVFFDNISAADVTPEACLVTFTVDMTPAESENIAIIGGPFVPGGADYPYLNGINGGVDGSYWSWTDEGYSGPAQYQMNQIGDSALYTITVPVNAGQQLDLVYKYGIDGYDNEAGSGDNHNRYIRSYPNYSMPTDLWDGQGSGNSNESSFGNLTVSGARNAVTLTWLGRPGVHLQSTSNLANPVWTNLPLTDGTNLVVGQGPGSSPPVGYATQSYNVGGANTALFYRLIGPQ